LGELVVVSKTQPQPGGGRGGRERINKKSMIAKESYASRGFLGATKKYHLWRGGGRRVYLPALWGCWRQTGIRAVASSCVQWQRGSLKKKGENSEHRKGGGGNFRGTMFFQGTEGGRVQRSVGWGRSNEMNRKKKK